MSPQVSNSRWWFEPVHVVQGGGLDLLAGAPGRAGLDQLGLVQPEHRLGQRVVVGVAHGADRGLRAGGGQPLGEGDGGVLRSRIMVVYQPGQAAPAAALTGPDGLLQASRTRLVRMVVAARQPRICRE
jgi:hypothetical protein